MTAIQKLAGNFTEAGIDDEVILMRLDNGELLSLTSTGSSVWRLIDGRRDRSALIAELNKQYAGNREDIDRDVGQLLDQLKEAGLVAEG
jgi:hypothetical protein